MGYEFRRTAKFDILGRYQEPIREAVSKALEGAAVDYAPLPFGKVALVVVSPMFKSRSEDERRQLVVTSIIASLRINPDDYLAGILCWTPDEQKHVHDSVETPPDSA